ncbi:hypothetical protein MA16_Dca015874 [Dendrobium catenatum]|uniref:Uncharacterized protein n=1 Tax=Dendrobium catenatum TaxID=906689 RepID=A0A2I0VMJ9_9ASPA|nr:hypothetical protein MA16_Dca015874 [Dendrobium catenatum]
MEAGRRSEVGRHKELKERLLRPFPSHEPKPNSKDEEGRSKANPRRSCEAMNRQ